MKLRNRSLPDILNWVGAKIKPFGTLEIIFINALQALLIPILPSF